MAGPTLSDVYTLGELAWMDSALYFRIIAVGFWAYDWALTIAAELRLYKRQAALGHVNVTVVGFIGARYLGAIALALNLLGHFGKFWAPESCQSFFRIMPIFQCIALWACYVLLIDRTLLLSSSGKGREKRDMQLLWILVPVALVAAFLQMFSKLWSFRTTQINELSKACELVADPHRNIGWVYFLAAALFDATIIGLTYTHIQHTLRGGRPSHNSSPSSTSTHAKSSARFSRQPAPQNEHWTAHTTSGPRSLPSACYNSPLPHYALILLFNLLNLGFYAANRGNVRGEVANVLAIVVTCIASARVPLFVHEQRGSGHMSFHLSDVRTMEHDSAERDGGGPGTPRRPSNFRSNSNFSGGARVHVKPPPAFEMRDDIGRLGTPSLPASPTSGKDSAHPFVLHWADRDGDHDGGDTPGGPRAV